LNCAKNLEFIGRAGSGMDNIDVVYTEKHNIRILNAPEGNRDSVAEHAIGMLLMLFNRLHIANQQVKKMIWDREANRGYEVKGKTISIIGYGNTGSAFARRLGNFGCKVLSYDKKQYSYGDSYTQESTMKEIFSDTDVLSLHIPLTNETRYLVNESYIAQFKKPFYLINTSRGEVVNLAHLSEAIQAGKILGACLDVLENENLQKMTAKEKGIFKNLQKNDHVIFSPHVAGWTKESFVRINEVLTKKIKRYLKR